MAAGDTSVEKKKKKKSSSDRTSPTKNGKTSTIKTKKTTSSSSTKNVRDVKSSELTTKMPEVGKRIRVYRNGDPYHKGLSVSSLNCHKVYHTLRVALLDSSQYASDA